jgi:hypothetical protein
VLWRGPRHKPEATKAAPVNGSYMSGTDKIGDERCGGGQVGPPRRLAVVPPPPVASRLQRLLAIPTP